jgi:hypothetical protein
MMRDEPDPVLMLVAGLRAPRPSTARGQRVRQRCHDVMNRDARRRDAPGRDPTPLLRRVADLALISVVGGYAVIALVQAAQMAAQVLALY